MNRFLRNTLVIAMALALAAASAWLSWKGYRRVTTHRLMARAAEYLARKDFPNASRCVEHALQVSPASPAANSAMADLLEHAGNPAAVIWRQRAAELDPRTPAYHLLWAQTALKAHDFRSARLALQGLDEKTRSGAVYHKLAGALAWGLNQPGEAEKHYREALRLEPENELITVNLNNIRLASTNQAVADAARASLAAVPPSAPFRSAALAFLIRDALARKDLPKALEFSQERIERGDASFEEKMAHLDLLRRVASPDIQSWLSTVQRDATNSAPAAALLGRWLAAHDNPANGLRWLESLPQDLQAKQPVPLAIAQCRAATKDWSGLESSLKPQDWGDTDFLRLAFNALAMRSQDEDMPWLPPWRDALRQSSHHLDRLSRLARLADQWGWTSEQIAILRQIGNEFPRETWAKDKLIAALYQSGDLQGLKGLLKKTPGADLPASKLTNNLALTTETPSQPLQPANASNNLASLGPQPASEPQLAGQENQDEDNLSEAVMPLGGATELVLKPSRWNLYVEVKYLGLGASVGFASAALLFATVHPLTSARRWLPASKKARAHHTNARKIRYFRYHCRLTRDIYHSLG